MQKNRQYFILRDGEIMYFYIQFFLLLVSLAGCSTQLSQEGKDNQDLVKSFELDKGGFAQFESTETTNDEKDCLREQALKVQNSHENAVSKNNQEKKVTKPLTKIVEKVPVSSKFMIPSSYPEGYPEPYKEYNSKFAKVWHEFQPAFFTGEEYVLVIEYLGLTAGYITVRTLEPVKLGNRLAWHIKARLQSAAYYQYIYSVDDFIESFVDAETYLPLKFQLIQRESVQDVDDLQLFDDSQLKTFFWYKRLKRGELKKIESAEYVPKFFQDSFSALYFARGLPLKKHVVYEYPIVTRAKVWILKFEVIDENDVVDIEGVKVPALKIKAETHYPGVLSKKGDIVFWISNDPSRKVLKFTAKVKIGSLAGRLIKYTNGAESIP